MNQKIFISIASLEDNYLVSTIRDAISCATYPDRLIFGLSLQYVNEPDLSFLKGSSRIIRYDPDIDLPSAPGIIQIRSAIRSLVQDEEYFLQIDAHTRFTAGWDEYLINDLNDLRLTNPKTVISSQLWHEADIDRYTKIRIYPTYQYQLDIEGPTIHGELVDDPDLKVISTRMVNDKYFLNYYMSGNFYFAHRSYLHDISFPDYHKFPFEESELGLVTYCYGYDIVAPTLNNIRLFAGNDDKYHNTTDSRFWINVGGSWMRKWVFDDLETYLEACKLMIDGQNKYMSIIELDNSVESFYLKTDAYQEYLDTKDNWYKKMKERNYG